MYLVILLAILAIVNGSHVGKATFMPSCNSCVIPITYFYTTSIQIS